LLPSYDFSFENYSLQEIKKNKNKKQGQKCLLWHNIYTKYKENHQLAQNFLGQKKDGNRGKREVREAA
jgi:hypothetical protein